jgi:hypothetical protein
LRRKALAEAGREGGASPPKEPTADPTPQEVLSTLLKAYTFFLRLVREFIDAQLKALEEAEEAGEVRREKVKVE